MRGLLCVASSCIGRVLSSWARSKIRVFRCLVPPLSFHICPPKGRQFGLRQAKATQATSLCEGGFR